MNIDQHPEFVLRWRSLTAAPPPVAYQHINLCLFEDRVIDQHLHVDLLKHSSGEKRDEHSEYDKHCNMYTSNSRITDTLG